MNCHELDDTLAEYLEGELAPAQTEALLAHLEQCPACRAEFEAYQRQEEQLGRYFKLRLGGALEARVVQSVQDDLPEEALAARPAWRAWALRGVAALLFAALGLGAWTFYLSVVPRGHAVLATVAAAEGRVVLLEGGAPLGPGAPLRQGERIKVPEGGYLALRLADGNILEARGGTQLALNDLPGQFQVAMNRGQVWAHLNKKPKKPFHIQTAQLDAIAVGTVFGVEEGLDRSVVTVARGTVEVKAGSVDTRVTAGGVYPSTGGAQGAAFNAERPLAQRTDWSRYPEDLASLKQNAPAERRIALTVEAAATPAPPTPAAAAPAAPIAHLLDLLPVDTTAFLELSDWPGLMSEFHATAYPALLGQPAVQKWWASFHGNQYLNEFAGEVHLLELMNIAKLLDGQVDVAATRSGDGVLLADCASHEAEVQARLDALLSGQSQTTTTATVASGAPVAGAQAPISAADLQKLRERVWVGGGRLLVASSAELVRKTQAQLLKGEPTGFAQSDFCRKVARNVTNPRFIMAADLSQAFTVNDATGKSDEARALAFSGLPGLDTLIISPSFKGRGMNQAARLAFKDKRYGVLGWLGVPAPMRGFDFFSPDVHFFASAIVLSPRQMFYDYLVYLSTGADHAAHDDWRAWFDQHQAFFDSFGHEVALGVDSPILPIPNIKVVIEVNDRAACEAQLDQIVEALKAKLLASDRFCYREETDYKGIKLESLVVDGLVLIPTWAFVDDFLVVGPGPEFVRNTIDVYQSKLSIAREPRLLALLPEQAETNFSLLVYQDVARSIPELLKSKLAPNLGGEAAAMIPNLDFLERFRAPGIAYAYAQPSYVDLYFSAPTGVDLNVGMAVPLVANWLAPHTAIGQTVDKYAQAVVALQDLAAAAEQFQQQNGRLPDSLDELADPQYIDKIPADPFAATPGATLHLIKGPQPGQITLYSIGPDGKDDQAQSEVNPDKDINGPGDIVVRLPREKTATQ